jgi:rare lipoprotein A
MKNFAPAALGAAVLFAVMSFSAQASTGVASYYGPGFAGKKTASGERFNPGGLTAAHRSLPFGTRLKLTNLANGVSVIVRVNDRGPFVHGRVLDVSHGAARVLGMTGSGTARLQIERIGGGGQVADNSTPAPRPSKGKRAAQIEADNDIDWSAQRREEAMNRS